MASNKKKTSRPSSGNGGSIPSTKRPGRTIDLEAEDVTIEDVPAKETSPKAGKKAESKSDADPDKRADDDDRRDDKASASLSGQRTDPTEIKSFVTHLAAGLIGGLVGVIGAGIVLDRFPVTSETVTPGDMAPLVERLSAVETKLAELPADNTPLVERLSALETELAALPKSDPAPDVREAAGKLEIRVTALEKKPPEERPEIKDFATRLGKLESTLKTLREAGEQEGASGVAQSAALTGRIDEVSTQLETRIGGLKKDVEALSKALETRVTGQAQESDKVADSLRMRLGSFEEKIASLEETIAGATASLPARAGDGAALALAFERLRRAAERGHPYADQLTALEDIAPDGLDLTELETNAATGIATNAELLSALPGVLKAAHAAIVTSGNGTFLERVVTNARSVVRIRRIGPLEGESPAQVLSRMEVQLKALNLAGVLREAKGLKGGALEVVQPWIDKARARRASEERLDKLGQHLLGALQTNTEEKR
ncbi:MAG: hypothetical protein ACTSP0_03450 [Alphaproteobacteria bacterium]